MAEKQIELSKDYWGKYDLTLPANQAKQVPAETQPFVPLAHWVELAGNMAIVQTRIKDKNGEMLALMEKRQILQAQANQLEVLRAEVTADINVLNPNLQQGVQLISAVRSLWLMFP
jgi:hypothetical protein